MPPTAVCLSHLVQQGAHTCKHLRSSQGLAFLQAALSLWRRGNLVQTIPYKLQTCTLLLLRKDSFFFSPMLDEALRRIEDFSRLTLHFIMHHIGISKTKPKQKIKPSEKPQTCNSPCLHTACTTTTSFKRRTLFSTSDLHGMNNMIDCTHSVQACMYDGLISLKIKTEKLRTSKIKNLSCWYHWHCNIFITCCIWELHSVLRV